MRRQRTSQMDQAVVWSYWREEDARAVLETWAASGTSLTAFARAHGLSPARVLRWERRLRQEPSELTFHPIELVSAPGRERESLELVVRGDRRIVIGADFDAVLLRRLVETVESWTC